MSRRNIAKFSLAVVIVLIASLSTVRVRQAWGEQQARSSFDSSRHQVTQALARGATVGLYASELAPFRHLAGALNRVPTPSSSLFWGSQEAFYNRQAQAYRSLAGSIDAKIAAVSAQARVHDDSNLASVQKSINRAQTFGLDTTTIQSQVAEDREQLTHATTPKLLRQIGAATGTQLTSLTTSISARSQYVSSVLNTAGNTVAGVQTVADNESAQAKNQLSVITLFKPKVSSLGGQVDDADSAVHAQSVAFVAAVKEAGLHDLTAQIAALYSKTMPSKLIVVSTENQWATMYDNGTEVYNTPVTTGGPELPTDHGIFHIYEKISPFVFHSPWPEGSPYYYPPTPIEYWMPFDGQEGLHDASWRSNFGPGSNYAPTDLGTGYYILGTHGCVNLPNDAASFVWDWAPVGTTVVVT